MNTQTMIALFWVALCCTTLAAGMGIASIWIPDMWTRYSWSWKLWETSSILAGTAFLLAVLVWAFRWFVR